MLGNRIGLESPCDSYICYQILVRKYFNHLMRESNHSSCPSKDEEGGESGRAPAPVGPYFLVEHPRLVFASFSLLR